MTETTGPGQAGGQTFFISRAGADREFARWLAEELHKDGHATILQDNDFGHRDFMAAMHETLAGPARIIALYSRAYFDSEYCLAEARHPLISDPSNRHQRLVPLRIELCSPPGLFQGIAYTDLVALREEGASALKDGIWRALKLTEQGAAGAPGSTRDTQFRHREIYRDPRFKGREDLLAEIHAAVKAGDMIAVKALHGVGGVGKSTLAREYAARHAGEYQGVWWIRAETPDTLTADLIEMGGKYITGLEIQQDREAAWKMALNAIETLNAPRPWLLVYDNVPDPAAIDGKLPRAGAHVLLTTRHPNWHGAARPVDVDVFAPDVAASFLLERTGRQDAAGAAELAGRLGYLPLALEQAAGYLTEAPHMPFTGEGGYLSYLDEMIKKRPAGGSYSDSVYGAVSLSLERAAGEHDKAEALFGLMAWMAPDQIPLSLFEGAEGFEGLALTEAIAALTRTSLVKHTPFETGEPALSVHRLSQDVMRTRLGAKGGDEAALDSALALLAPAMAALHPQDVRNWPALDRLEAHGLAAADQADRQGRDLPDAATLLSVVALLRAGRAQYAEAEPLYRRALAIFEASYGPDHPEVATGLNNLAGLLDATNRAGEAEPLYRRALAIDEASYGPDHPEVATDLNNLAGLLYQTNRAVEAEPLYRRALAIRETSSGPDHPEVAQSLNNLALLLDATNRAGEAEPLYRRALAIREASYGPDHPDVATSLNNLALLLHATNRAGEAEPLYRRALAILEASLPEGHSHISIARDNLAACQAQLAAASAPAPTPPLDAPPPSPSPLPQDKTRQGGAGMTGRQIAGIALLLIGLWAGWGSWQAFSQYTSRMPDPDYAAVIADPVFLIPGLRALAAIFGGLLVLLRWPGGAWLGLLAALLTGFLAAAILAAGGDISLWQGHAVLAIVLFALSLALLLRKRAK